MIAIYTFINDVQMFLFFTSSFMLIFYFLNTCRILDLQIFSLSSWPINLASRAFFYDNNLVV